MLWLERCSLLLGSGPGVLRTQAAVAQHIAHLHPQKLHTWAIRVQPSWSILCTAGGAPAGTGVYLFNPGEDKPRNPVHVGLFIARLGDFPTRMATAPGHSRSAATKWWRIPIHSPSAAYGQSETPAGGGGAWVGEWGMYGGCGGRTEVGVSNNVVLMTKSSSELTWRPLSGWENFPVVPFGQNGSVITPGKHAAFFFDSHGAFRPRGTSGSA